MEFRKTHTIFEQIADHICNSILSRLFGAGDKVPSVRQMAADLQVNPNTMMRAYTHLQEQGILCNRRGIGFFVAEEAPAIILDRERERFLRTEVPSLFETMNRLGIEIADLERLYKAEQKEST